MQTSVDISTRINERLQPGVSVDDALKLSKQILRENQTELEFNEPDFEAKVLLEHACELSSVQLITHANTRLTNAQLSRLSTCLQSRVEGQPIAYITGKQAFWTLELAVSEDTLIPRSDTETLVEAAIGLPLCENAQVLDMGTGTGAIALAIKSERANWQVTACDFKPSIVALAQDNAKRNGIDIQCILSDWFSAFEPRLNKHEEQARFDLIVTNPPYVESDSSYLERGDLRFEPDSALTSGLDGLSDIRHIISQASKFLKTNAYLLIEHGFEQSKAIQELMNQAGFVEVETKQDLNKLDRATMGKFPG